MFNTSSVLVSEESYGRVSVQQLSQFYHLLNKLPRTYPCPWRFTLTAASITCAALCSVQVSLCTYPGSQQWILLQPLTGHGNFRDRFFLFYRKEHFMSAQVAQNKHSNDLTPARLIQCGWLSQIFFFNNRVPFSNPYGSQWDTLTGNPDNEYRKRRRHRYRLSKNIRTLHCPHPIGRARNRLRTLVLIT